MHEIVITEKATSETVRYWSVERHGEYILVDENGNEVDDSVYQYVINVMAGMSSTPPMKI
jgi:hypothetical protein